MPDAAGVSSKSKDHEKKDMAKKVPKKWIGIKSSTAKLKQVAAKETHSKWQKMKTKCKCKIPWQKARMEAARIYPEAAQARERLLAGKRIYNFLCGGASLDAAVARVQAAPHSKSPALQGAPESMSEAFEPQEQKPSTDYGDAD